MIGPDEAIVQLDPAGEQAGAVIVPRGGARGAIVRVGAAISRFRTVLANLTAFTALQAASYLVPVVTIPYFARTLGVDGMGQLAIAGAFSLAAGVLIDYAIQLSGTRFAAARCEDRLALAQYLNTATGVKLAILAPIALALVVARFLLPPLAEHFWNFAWSLAAVAMTVLFPQWLFQGMLAMPLAARILVVCRIGAAVAALMLVRTRDDVFVVPMMQAIGGVAAIVLATVALHRRYGIVAGRPRLVDVRTLLRENWSLFAATAWGAVYSHGAVIIMSSMLSATAIGYYSIAQKISQAFVSMFNVAAQTAFPSLVRLRNRGHTEMFGRQINFMIVTVAIAAVSTLFAIFVLREPIYMFFAGRDSARGLTIFSLWLAASFFHGSECIAQSDHGGAQARQADGAHLFYRWQRFSCSGTDILCRFRCRRHGLRDAEHRSRHGCMVPDRRARPCAGAQPPGGGLMLSFWAKVRRLVVARWTIYGRRLALGGRVAGRLKLRGHVDRIHVDRNFRCDGDLWLGVHSTEGRIIIGGNVSASGPLIVTAVGLLTVGEGALFGPNVLITDHYHGNTRDPAHRSMPPSQRPLYSPGTITIGNNVQFGANSVVLAPATIGDGAIIGANAVVKGCVPAGSVYTLLRSPPGPRSTDGAAAGE